MPAEPLRGRRRDSARDCGDAVGPSIALTAPDDRLRPPRLLLPGWPPDSDPVERSPGTNMEARVRDGPDSGARTAPSTSLPDATPGSDGGVREPPPPSLLPPPRALCSARSAASVCRSS